MERTVLMKKSLLAAVVLLFIFALGGCGGESPKKAVSNMFEALKTGDMETAAMYTDCSILLEESKLETMEESETEFTKKSEVESTEKSETEFTEKSETESTEESGAAEGNEIFSKLLQNLHYKILSVDRNDDEAVLEAEITNTDMNLILRELNEQMFVFSFSERSSDEINKKTEEILLTLLDKEGNQTVTNTVEIQMFKEDEQWKISMNETLAKALIGNLTAAQEKASEDAPGGQ